ncbi:MAG: SRPBCC domain-containing protein [Actinomycetes bacterium]
MTTSDHATSGTLAPVRRSVHVRCAPEQAFRVFTDRIGDWWPLLSHSVYEAESAAVAFEDGLLVEQSLAGERSVWGTVTGWEPPHRLSLTWHPGTDPERPTAVEVVFRPEGEGTTVELVHHGWELLGERAPRTRESYDRGWPAVLDRFGSAADEAA